MTGLYTVLVDGDDVNEPISDAVRGILDGHIVLTRDLAIRNHYPSIDILQSVSRVMGDVIKPEHQKLANQVRTHLAIYHEAKDLIDIGAYVHGSNPRIDAAITYREKITHFLCQEIDEKVSHDVMLEQLKSIFT